MILRSGNKGGIYEWLCVSGGGKDLGRLFTPRDYINMVIYGLNLEKINTSRLTKIHQYMIHVSYLGGFLTRIYNY